MTKQKGMTGKELQKVKSMLPELVPPSVETAPVPPGFEDYDDVQSMLPVANFTIPGQWIKCTYMGVQEIPLGDRKSRLYNFISEDPSETAFAVWGSTIFDRKMDVLSPAKGTGLMIQYLGEVKTGRGLNPAKDFRLMVKRQEV